jgi:hypothetical protein
MTVAALFDLVEKEASGNHLLAREKFGVVVGCLKSEIFMHIRADSGPRWHDLAVWVLRSQPTGGAEWVPSGEMWSRDKVRESLAAIPSCDGVTLMVGGESINITLDERWIIREVTHGPILAPSDTLESLLGALRDRNGLRPPTETASPIIRQAP